MFLGRPVMLEQTLLSCHRELLFCILGPVQEQVCSVSDLGSIASVVTRKQRIMMVVHNFEFLS